MEEQGEPAEHSSGTESVPPWSSWRQVLLWFGVGVLIAGIGVLGYAAFIARDLWREADSLGAALSMVIVVAVFPLVTLAWVFVARRRLAAGAWLVIVMLVVGIWVHRTWLDLAQNAFVGDGVSLVVSVYAETLVSVVLVMVAVGGTQSRRPMPRLGRGASAVAFVGAVLMVSVAAVVVVGSRVDATTTTAVPAPSVPTDLTQVAWRWSEGELVVHGAVAAGAGVVVATSRGIFALDGRTGQERWHYLRDDAEALRFVAVDGGRGVIASFEGRLHAFDAFTGELRWREGPSTRSSEWYFGGDATNSTIIQRRGGDGPNEFSGTDVGTGEQTWQYGPPPGCEMDSDGVVAGMVIITLTGCPSPRQFGTIALDGSTGQPAWRLGASAEHQAWLQGPWSISLRHGLVEMSNLDNSDTRYLDPRDGREIVGLAQISEEQGILAIGSGEVFTYDWQLYRLGEPGPRWQAQDGSPPDERGSFINEAISPPLDRPSASPSTASCSIRSAAQPPFGPRQRAGGPGHGWSQH